MMVDTITERASDFTSRDFDSWIIELRNRVQSAFPSWTDFNTANFGNILLELFAHTLDVMSFTQDQQFLETRIVFATLRKSMINLGKLVSFTLPGASVASVDLTFTIADGNPRVSDIIIPKGTVLVTIEGDTEFDLLQDVTISAGQIQVTGASAENARERTTNFVTDGSPNQEVVLAEVPYVDQSSVVTVLGTPWTEQTDLLSSGPTDLHYFVDVDEDQRATVKFGDGINGAIPTGAAIAVYKTGGGEDGNVEALSIGSFRDSNQFPTLAGEQVQLTVFNPVGAGGGVDRMSVEEARVAIPASVRTAGARSVTREDFEDNALKVRGVARAMMLTSDEDPGIPDNEGRLYIVPVGGGLPSAALKTEVLDFINNNFPPCLTFTFTVEDPVLVVINISATVFLVPGKTEVDTRTAIEAAYDAFFALNNPDGSVNTDIDFGFRIRTNKMPPGTLVGELPFSDLFNAMRDAVDDTGDLVLRKIEEDSFTPADDVPILDTQFPIIGSITLVNGDTAAAF